MTVYELIVTTDNYKRCILYKNYADAYNKQCMVRAHFYAQTPVPDFDIVIRAVTVQ